MTTPLAGRKEWTGLAILLLPVLMISMDISVLLYAVPFISHDLAPTSTQLLWILDMYGFVLAGMLLTMGALGDRIGRRRLLMFGGVAFAVASVAAAYSGSAELLIGARALLGLAGATLMPSTLALIRNMFHDAKQRQAAIGVWTAGMMAGIALGPVVGGFLLDHFWWGSVFLINVPACLLLLALGPVLLPEYRAPHAGRFDFGGAVLSMAAVLPVIYGIKEMARDGVHLTSALSIAAGLLVGAVFVLRQRRLANPLIDLKLFGDRAFSASITVNLLVMFGMTGSAIYNTQYLQLVLGMTPFVAALWSIPATVAVGVAAGISSALAKTVRPAYIVGGGLAVTALGFVILSLVRADSSLWVVMVGAVAVGSGVVSAATLISGMVLGAAPADRAGAASAVSETSNELGGALGIAILGSIGTAVYRTQMTGDTLSGLPAAARETLGGATAVAASLPERAGAALLDTARVAFTHGMNVSAVVAAILMTAAALAAVRLLRRVEIAPEPELAPEPEPAEAAA
ncbi:MFS transporter [Streptosporangiaceae bacterium NEAU-GS5]|nr:MFS transporter [Streptosporangiaceae bacterium NEAU-GS5]